MFTSALSTSSQYQPRPIDGDFIGKHIVSVEQFTRADLDLLFASVAQLRARVHAHDRTVGDLCAGRVMATLFYEASTRTDMSFQAAMLRLGGEVIAASGGVQFSSVYKGENLADTVRAVACYADAVVLRHPELLSSHEAAYQLDQLAFRLGTQPVVISAGDGAGEHPTQALLDLFTLFDFKGSADGLSITLAGDLLHGRTVHSLAKLLARYGARGAQVNCVAPEVLRMPAGILDVLRNHDIRVTETDDLTDVLVESDVIYWTRVQQERFTDAAAYNAIADRFIMTPDVLGRARSDAILMHPLPRKHEMGTTDDHALLDADPRAVYFHQMRNGMFVRMAVLAHVLGALT